ncbi:MAG: hypothetical protein ACKO7B_17100, partial [Flavobacteriales bacterium]
MKIYTIFLLLCIGCATTVSAQRDTRKITFVGAARAQFDSDHYHSYYEEDTVTTAKLNSGNTLVDLGVNIRPNPQMEIQGMVRVRNDYGGFWGAGVSFDVRQLYVKGVAGGIVRYQLGDINYKLTPYTLWNSNQEMITGVPFLFQQQSDVVNYDHFYYNDNSWRQQGASAEVGFEFSKWIKEIGIKTVATRVKTTDFSQTNDRIFSGISLNLIQSAYLRMGFNYVNVFDIYGTSRSNTTFHHPVMTVTLNYHRKMGGFLHAIDAETGLSKWYYREQGDDSIPNWQGKFADAKYSAQHLQTGITGGVQLKYVSSDFRSMGAQTKRVNFNGQLNAFQRVGNDQSLRPVSMIDLMRESGLYTLQLQTNLMAFAPQYDNITPYGEATPNRQAMILTAGYDKKESPVNAKLTYYRGQEVRGEGTTTLRNFERYEAAASFNAKKYIGSKDKEASVQLRLRSDRTTRLGSESVPSIDLSSKTITAGVDYEWKKQWHLLAAFQLLQYEGFELRSVRDINQEIFNFTELNLKGSEQLASLGAKYTFSDKSFLSLQYYQFLNNTNQLNAA